MGSRSRGQLLVPVVIQQDSQDVRIPPWVLDHQSFRRWATSDQFPDRGQYAFLNGEVWVDTSMERFAHNQLKTRLAASLTQLTAVAESGHFLSDRMMLTNDEAGLSTEPDGMFVSHQTIRSGKARLERGAESLEVVGTPDMVLEIISPSSRHKDTVVLRELYWLAGIPEYWLGEARGDQVSLEILKRGAKGYVSVRKRSGWLRSAVFGTSVQVTSKQGPGNLPSIRSN
jgi:Uma2 family endonuclease